MVKMWKIETKGFNKDEVVHNGNKFLIGNGFLGYRGTLEEFTKAEFACLNLPGVYDKFQDKWRESVNAPNPFYTKVIYQNQELNPLITKVHEHKYILDMKHGLFRRYTKWLINDVEIEIKSERFASLDDIHLLAMKYSLKASKDIEVDLYTGIDVNIWDINGPHLGDLTVKNDSNILTIYAETLEKKIPIVIGEGIEIECSYDNKDLIKKIKVSLEKDKEFTFYKFAYVNHHETNLQEEAIKKVKFYLNKGYNKLLTEHKNAWFKRWDISDVIIKGDDEAQLAIRYSIYHLIILSQQHTDKVSIPARGVSGQTYKGAVFWDTEMFMLPFYLCTDHQTAKNLIKYRINTLDGARKKAKEYGYKGAFYAWESQEGGLDACTHFNVTDVFTNRPMRTYFRDKQIHISAAVAMAIYNTFLHTKDISLLIEGGAEVILECARFYLSYGYMKLGSDKFELLDVTGPDEYHERVNNNAYTNKVVKKTFSITLEILKLFADKYPYEYDKLMTKLNYHQDLELINKIIDNIYLQTPNKDGIIEQFDGYFKLEDISLNDLKKRLLHPNEYWGGANGIATHTQIIKQADVILMLYLFKDEYDKKIIQANWNYYEKRTEHGSSLSACMYALTSCLINNPDWAYPYFMKSATIDLVGATKLYAGGIYIGGTHPASSGGAYMTAIFGFAGVKFIGDKIEVNPKLPKNWQGMQFKLIHNNQVLKINIDYDIVNIEVIK